MDDKGRDKRQVDKKWDLNNKREIKFKKLKENEKQCYYSTTTAVLHSVLPLESWTIVNQ